MENLIKLLLISFVNVCFHNRCGSTSTQKSTFGELCRFEGTCLNCTDGGCDDMCQFYDNSCCVNKSSTNVLQQKWQYSCVRKFPDMYDLHLDCRGSFDGVYGVYMVTKCSELWTDELIKSKCEDNSDKDIVSRIPVYDNANEIVTYKNMYCAFCNRLSLERLRFWKFDLMCDDGILANETDFEAEHTPGHCFIRLIYKRHRMCAFNVIETCDSKKNFNPSLRDKCENGLTQNVYVWKDVRTYRVYKNEFCARCNYETGQLQCWAFQAFTCWPQDLPPYRSVKAMISLDINGEANKDSTRLYNDTCGKGVLYDPFDTSCLNITCLPSLNLCISGTCHLIKLAASEFMTQNDSSLYLFPIGKIIEHGRYFMEDSYAYVCLDDNQYILYEMIQETTVPAVEITTRLTTTVTSSVLVSLSKPSASSDMSAGKLTVLMFVILTVCC